MKNINYQALSSFFNDISVMISSGMTSEQAVYLLKEEAEGPLKNALLIMLAALEEGSGLCGAMKKSAAFPEYAVSMVQAGEEAGKLEEVASSLSLYYDRRANMNRLIVQSMVQPLWLLLILAVIMGVFVGMVLPVLTGVYNSLGGDAAIYVSGAYIVGGAAFAVIFIALAALAAIWICFKTARRGPALMAIWEKSVFTRRAALLFAQAQFIGDVEARVSGGIMIDRSFSQAADAVVHKEFMRRAVRCAEKISAGQSIADVLYEEKLFEHQYTHIIYSGAKSGKLEQALFRVGGMLSAAAEECGSAIAKRVEPVLTGFFTLAVGVSLISVILPLIGVVTAMV